MKKHIKIIGILLLVALIAYSCSKIAETRVSNPPIFEEPRATSSPKELGLSEIVDLEKAKIYSVAVADFNNDGFDDVVAGVYGGYSDLLLNNKDNTFTRNPLLGREYNTEAVAVIDVDKDGKKDIIMANNQQPSLILRNLGEGIFEEYKELPKTVSKDIAVADFDNDGYEDFVISTSFKDNYVYFNDNNGDFTRVLVSGSLPVNAVKAADIDSDGFKDIIFGLDKRTTRFFMNEKDRKFVLSHEFEDDRITYAIELSDVNNDGRIDVIQGNNKDQNIIFINKESGFEKIPALGTGNTYSLVTTDFNKDGKKEIVVGNYEQSIQIYEASEEYPLVKEITTPLKNYVRDLAVGDFNNDGYPDLVVGREEEMSQIYLG